MKRPAVEGSSGGSGKAIVNPKNLLDEIVQPLAQLGSALLEHARAHRDRSRAEHDAGVLAAWRTAAPALLEGVLQLATTGLETNARPIMARCPRSVSVGSRPRARFDTRTMSNSKPPQDGVPGN